jgi:hypothetical protein
MLRAKAKALGKAASVPRAMALALGTDGLTGGPDRLCAESMLAQLSAKEPPAGPLVSSVPRAGPAGSRHRCGAHLRQGPPDTPPVPRAAHRLSAESPSVPLACRAALGTAVGPAIHAVSCGWACDES